MRRHFWLTACTQGANLRLGQPDGPAAGGRDYSPDSSVAAHFPQSGCELARPPLPFTLRLLRTAAPTPASPVPSSRIVVGSGMAVKPGAEIVPLPLMPIVSRPRLPSPKSENAIPLAPLKMPSRL